MRLLAPCLGLGFCLALWTLAHIAYGPFALPSPAETARALLSVLASGEAENALGATLLFGLLGWIAGSLGGLALGLAAGFWRPLRRALQPVAVVLLGTPPVAWIVLAILWFSADGFDATFTVAVSIAPMIFLSTAQGVQSRSPQLDEMAANFRASPRLWLTDVLAPQIVAHLLPAATSSLGFALKICVMAEVMGDGGGVGGRLAEARANLDLPEAMAWIVLIVAAILALDLVLIAPLRARGR
jgi:NitT/TauT family transport system permease protein